MGSHEELRKSGIYPSGLKMPKFHPGKGIDCCKATPDFYKVVAELPQGRLIEMTLKAGGKDNPHDHPAHYLYVVTGGKLKLSPPPGASEGSAEVEMPAGAAMLIPEGPHQVENIGDTDVLILFVEPTASSDPMCMPCTTTLADFVSPMAVCPDCYKVLFEDGSWFIGEMKLKAGETDKPHSHNDHLVYVLEGESICIYPGKEIGEEKMELQVKPGAAMPVPQGHHIVKNTGSTDSKMIFFELK
mmetsp:Transcript_67108/g.143591  ORF Transcript_67108/g.143591 Transcript_67108/m.143591 type:complete len:243 (-) Transcript_67108:69-797(-)